MVQKLTVVSVGFYFFKLGSQATCSKLNEILVSFLGVVCVRRWERERTTGVSVLSCRVGLRDWLRSVDLVTGAFLRGAEVCDVDVKVMSDLEQHFLSHWADSVGSDLLWVVLWCQPCIIDRYLENLPQLVKSSLFILPLGSRVAELIGLGARRPKFWLSCICFGSSSELM